VTTENQILGHVVVGRGPVRVIVLNDWLSDTSSWDAARNYLDEESVTYVFADLRGYGRSRGLGGAYTVKEAAGDVLELASSLGFERFAIVGHSMSALIALYLAQHAPQRIERAALLTPAPPRGFGGDQATVDHFTSVSLGDDAKRLTALNAFVGDRLSHVWVQYKLSRWRATAEPRAVAGYALMFVRDGLPEPELKVRVPVLAITGEQDGDAMRSAATKKALEPLCERLTVIPLEQCGHYPMQEVPPLLVSHLERFILEAP
jgi:pimeloyl-ACP methyl ester carboxylesterase